MDSRKNKIGSLILAIIIEFGVLFGIVQLQGNVLMSFPLAIRAILMIVLQWVLLIVPIVFMKKDKISLSVIGFSKINAVPQLLTGVFLGAALSMVLTVFPIIMGLKDLVGSSTYTQLWQFCYQFVYMIFGVSFAEEFFYRGFLFERVMTIGQSKRAAVIISSCIFGLSHIFNGSMVQVITTSLLGVLFCVCRDKIKNCTTLSLIIMHGIHNALVTLFVVILP